MIILVDAAIYATILSILCVGLTLTYKITNVPNFAHTSFAILGMYMALIVTKIFDANPYLAIPMAFVVSGATSLFLYYFVLRILQKRTKSFLPLIVATLSFDIFMIGILNILADTITSEFQVISRDFTLRSHDILIFDMPAILILSLAATACLVLGLYYMLYKTKFGIKMRCSIENTSLAQIYCINTQRVFCVSWFLSGGLGGTAGVFLAVWFQGDPGLSVLLLPSVFAGSIVGGFTSIYGSIVGGLVIGFSEILVTDLLARNFGYWIVSYRPIIPFLFIITTLLLWPRGLSEIIKKVQERI